MVQSFDEAEVRYHLHCRPVRRAKAHKIGRTCELVSPESTAPLETPDLVMFGSCADWPVAHTRDIWGMAALCHAGLDDDVSITCSTMNSRVSILYLSDSQVLWTTCRCRFLHMLFWLDRARDSI